MNKKTMPIHMVSTQDQPQNEKFTHRLKAKEWSPNQCGSVGWASSHKQNVTSLTDNQNSRLGCVFSTSQSACEGQPVDVSVPHWCFYPTPFPSFSLSLKINKIFQSKGMKKDTSWKWKWKKKARVAKHTRQNIVQNKGHNKRQRRIP